MVSVTVRIRTSSGVKRMVLTGDLGDTTVGDLKMQIISDKIFSDRGENFGLKMEGKRKNVSLDDLSVTLESIGVEDGTMFTVDFTGGIRAEAEHSAEKAKPVEDLFTIPDSPKKPKRKQIDKDPNTPKKERKAVAAVQGAFDVGGYNVQDLASYFMDKDFGPESCKDLGSFSFNQFISAARIHSMVVDKVVIKIIDDNPIVDENLISTSGSSSSSSRSSSGCSSGSDDPNIKSRLHITFRSNAGKLYEETCDPLNEDIICQLILLVLERSSTKRRRNIEMTRNKFSVNSLASDAPWVLWPLVNLYGTDPQLCKCGIDKLLDRALVNEIGVT